MNEYGHESVENWTLSEEKQKIKIGKNRKISNIKNWIISL